ncbi:MAG: KamA family radical SAM protein [Magnetococcales bacterium]|nr:KamA family radical SAM protein [Magnetococcales bacterium]
MNHSLEISLEFPSEAREAAEQFPFLVPPALVARLKEEGGHGPLSRQFLPSAEEMRVVPGYSADPLHESAAQQHPGLIAKYPGRVLLKVTTGCVVHCRFCFRRHVRAESAPPLTGFEPAFEAIAADETIREVILSGGDPLTLSDRRLQPVVARLAAIPHLHRLRIHTRVPLFHPKRISARLMRILTGHRLTPIVVLHVNHATELDQPARGALARMVEAGIPLLNQSVLLKGVNDDVESLVALCEALIDARVMPYYLHLLDAVSGAAHFEVPEARGRELMSLLRARLPGYAVPRLAREVVGLDSKQEILCS